MRFAACCHTTDCGPSITSAVDLFAAVRGQAVQEHRVGSRAAFISASSTVQPVERAQPRSRPRPPGPSTSTRRCRPRRRRAPRRTDRSTSSIDAAEVAGPVDDVGVELVARRRRDDELDARRARRRTRATRRRCCRRRRTRGGGLRASPKCSRSVRRSASAWHGCARSDSRLTTGTSTTAAIRSSVAWSNTRAAITAAHSRRACGRRPRPTRARRGRPPRAGRRSGGRRASTTAISIEMRVRADGFSNSSATPVPGEHAAGRAPGRPSTRRAWSRIAPSSARGRGRRPRGSRRAHAGTVLRAPSREDRDRGVDLVVGDEQRRREPQRGRRDRVDDEPGVEARAARPASASMPGASSAAMQQPDAAHVGDAGERRAAPR